MTPDAFRPAFTSYLREIASWRRRKAAEYDRDARNLRGAASLEELADYVLTLPADDSRLQELARLTMAGEAFRPDQRVSYEIGRFRFHYGDTGLDAFLDTLVELAIVDKGEMGRFGGRLPEGDDPWG